MEALLHELRVCEEKRKRVEGRLARLREWCEGTGFECALPEEVEDGGQDDAVEAEGAGAVGRWPRETRHLDPSILKNLISLTLKKGGHCASLPGLSRRTLAKIAQKRQQDAEGLEEEIRAGEEETQCSGGYDETDNGSRALAAAEVRDWLWQV